ncbi:alkaline phosphatase PhoX [Blastococcus deserti]|uniref:Alkaline phosphatase PhoX n=1 Tax=Blastococcus deserti TaxID=2259033 RepID=A0ABW4X7W9_9ACTN
MSPSPEPSAVGAAVSRRKFLGGVAAGAGIVLVGGCRAVFGAEASAGVGPLLTSDGLLDLPQGFRYRVLAEQGVTLLESGHVAPSDPDGAAAFPRRDGPGTVLVLNHEVGGNERYRVPHVGGLVYDPAAGGGTTTLVVDPDGTVVRHYVSLAGTEDNCAGGRTPWETWLSCEETENARDRRHGYVFEVDPFDEAANRDPKPIKALGRFAHEAVVVDPAEDVLYLTEDADEPHGCLYRWTAPADVRPLGRGSLRRLADDAGTLEALRASTDDGRHVPDLSEATDVGTTYRADWVPVPDRDAEQLSVRRQFRNDQITRGRKLEGMWWADDGAYVVSSYARTRDGSVHPHDGQVWYLDPRAGTLTLQLRFGVADETDVEPDGPDNITVSPHGGVIIAEDGRGAVHLLGATVTGETFFLARRNVAEDADEEFCGPVFSADGQSLFANLQGPGYTFMIRGPFDELSRTDGS